MLKTDINKASKTVCFLATLKIIEPNLKILNYITTKTSEVKILRLKILYLNYFKFTKSQ